MLATEVKPIDLQKFVLDVFNYKQTDFLTDESCISGWNEEIDPKKKLTKEYYQKHFELPETAEIPTNWTFIDVVENVTRSKNIMFYGGYKSTTSFQECLTGFYDTFAVKRKKLCIFLDGNYLFQVTDLWSYIVDKAKNFNYSYPRYGITQNKDINFGEFFASKLQENYQQCLIVIRNFYPYESYVNSVDNLPNFAKIVAICISRHSMPKNYQWEQFKLKDTHEGLYFWIVEIMLNWLLFLINVASGAAFIYTLIQYSKGTISFKYAVRKSLKILLPGAAAGIIFFIINGNKPLDYLNIAQTWISYYMLLIGGAVFGGFTIVAALFYIIDKTQK